VSDSALVLGERNKHREPKVLRLSLESLASDQQPWPADFLSDWAFAYVWS
jgi:hypothetical protein